MAASITHLIIGERVYKMAPALERSMEVYGSFLAGCIIVDVHAFHDFDRRITHFAGHLDKASTDGFRSSCSSFLDELDKILRRPWHALSTTERAFVSGYLCHLAADECWKELGRYIFQKLNIKKWTELPFHPDVLLTAFDFKSRKELMDEAGTMAALHSIQIPDVFYHLPFETFCRHWELIQGYLTGRGTPESYIDLLQQSGKLDAAARVTYQQRFESWGKVLELIDNIGGVLPYLQSAVNRSLEVLPLLFNKSIENNQD